MIEDQLRLFDVPPCRCGDVHCVDCDVDTFRLHELYMVHDHVWPLDPRGGTLCVGCLEERIGRRLTPRDFTDVPLNDGGGSERLWSRQAGVT